MYSGVLQPLHDARLPHISASSLQHLGELGTGSFGEVHLSRWTDGLIKVAVKKNGVTCLSQTAIDNERKLLEVLLPRPHRNVLTVYGIVLDAPDGVMRLVLQYCPGGSLDKFLSQYKEPSNPVCLEHFDA